MPSEYREITDDERRWLRLEPTALLAPRDLEHLPSILRLGAGAEDSLATKLMRAAADEIERLRAAHQERDGDQ